MLSKEQIAKAYEALSRLVESQYSVAYPFHNPVSSDAELAIREIKAHIAYLEERAATMARICAGMALEEMQNAAFTYKSLVEIVQRREGRESLTARPEGG